MLFAAHRIEYHDETADGDSERKHPLNNEPNNMFQIFSLQVCGGFCFRFFDPLVIFFRFEAN